MRRHHAGFVQFIYDQVAQIALVVNGSMLVLFYCIIELFLKSQQFHHNYINLKIHSVFVSCENCIVFKIF